jgi:hypothetical protein
MNRDCCHHKLTHWGVNQWQCSSRCRGNPPFCARQDGVSAPAVLDAALVTGRRVDGKTVSEFVENKPASLDSLRHPAQPTEFIAQIVP